MDKIGSDTLGHICQYLSLKDEESLSKTCWWMWNTVLSSIHRKCRVLSYLRNCQRILQFHQGRLMFPLQDMPFTRFFIHKMLQELKQNNKNKLNKRYILCFPKIRPVQLVSSSRKINQ